MAFTPHGRCQKTPSQTHAVSSWRKTGTVIITSSPKKFHSQPVHTTTQGLPRPCPLRAGSSPRPEARPAALPPALFPFLLLPSFSPCSLPLPFFPDPLSALHPSDPVYSRFDTDRTTRSSWNPQKGIKDKELQESPGEGGVESDCKSGKASGRGLKAGRGRRSTPWGEPGVVRAGLSPWLAASGPSPNAPGALQSLSSPILGASWQKGAHFPQGNPPCPRAAPDGTELQPGTRGLARESTRSLRRPRSRWSGGKWPGRRPVVSASSPETPPDVPLFLNTALAFSTNVSIVSVLFVPFFSGSTSYFSMLTSAAPFTHFNSSVIIPDVTA